MQNEQLVNWVTQARSSGISDEAIQQQLVSLGWPPETISSTLLSAKGGRASSTPEPHVTKKALSKKSIVVTLMSLVVLIVVTAGYIFYSGRPYKKTADNNPKNSASANVSILTLHTEEDHINVLVEMQCYLYSHGQTADHLIERKEKTGSGLLTNAEVQARDIEKEKMAQRNGFTSYNEFLQYGLALSREQIAVVQASVNSKSQAMGCGTM